MTQQQRYKVSLKPFYDDTITIANYYLIYRFVFSIFLGLQMLEGSSDVYSKGNIKLHKFLTMLPGNAKAVKQCSKKASSRPRSQTEGSKSRSRSSDYEVVLSGSERQVNILILAVYMSLMFDRHHGDIYISGKYNDEDLKNLKNLNKNKVFHLVRHFRLNSRPLTFHTENCRFCSHYQFYSSDCHCPLPRYEKRHRRS
ncbi:CLUMA_CG019813, isoform A [Clunio marinus]|uniref:CLUMA_CG019813, isoform A n=1 Tax=Clunio marinus TaxID=568069 RepID=A0A1J1J231_9DIPT|nr:CLUMA_CG019813, isoform A [Clunio marinus]